MTRTTLAVLTALSLSTAARATATTSATGAASFQDDALAAMQAADPYGGWEIVPITTTAAAKTKADILIESLGSTAQQASYHGDVTLKRGVFAASSTDGGQGLVLLDDVLVCDDLGCQALMGVEPDEISFADAVTTGGCAWPFCGGDAAGLAAAYPVYVVVDIDYDRTGAEIWTVTDLLVGFGFIGVEPDEID